jgi:hypothetical protein
MWIRRVASMWTGTRMGRQIWIWTWIWMWI